MPDFLSNLLGSGFMPHGHCYFWRPDVLWLNVGSDLLIGAAYFSIPVALTYFVRHRRDVALRRVFLLFSAFILACGGTHLFSIVTVWNPYYHVEGLLKLATGLISAATAVVLWRLMPVALSLPSPSELAEANESLRAEVRERQRAEDELRRLNEELEHRVAERTEELARSNRDLQQFAYAASHDLQEPLRMVSSFVDLLGKRYGEQLDDRGRKYVDYAVDGAKRMRQMVDDLLTYARVGAEELPTEEIDADAALDEALTMLGERAEHVELTRDELPTVEMGPTDLQRIFQNLLSNAIKYSPETPRIHVGCSRVDGAWEISVSDEGIGIPEDQHERIFEVYGRLHSHADYPGTGIGLPICKRLVERRGGEMWVRSKTGKGSTFHFTVPDRRPSTDSAGDASKEHDEA